MMLLRFPAPRKASPAVADSLVSVEARLVECCDRQRRLREEGRRLAASVSRLRILARRMARIQARLRRSIDRLRDIHRSILPGRPGL